MDKVKPSETEELKLASNLMDIAIEAMKRGDVETGMSALKEVTTIVAENIRSAKEQS